MFKQYFLSLVAATSVFLLAVAIFAWSVDPYALYGEYTTEDSHQKPDVNNQNRLHKRHQLERNQYDAVILGSSRTHRAFDPSHNFFDGYNAYNLGMSGTQISEVFYSLLYADRETKLKKVLLFTDYNLQIDIESSENKPSTKIFKGNRRNILDRTEELRDTLLSVSALKDSYKTAFDNKANHNIITTRGVYLIKADNYHKKAFKRLEIEYLEKLTHNGIDNQISRKHHLYKQHFKNLLTYLHENKINTTIMISPLHARLMEVIHTSGLWGDFSDWKSLLVSLNEEVANKYNSPPFKIYDAAVYNEISTEVIVSNRNAKWFYESSHAKPNYGNMLMNDLSINNNQKYSVRLTNTNLKDHLERQEVLREVYAKENFEQIQHLHHKN